MTRNWKFLLKVIDHVSRLWPQLSSARLVSYKKSCRVFLTCSFFDRTDPEGDTSKENAFSPSPWTSSEESGHPKLTSAPCQKYSVRPLFQRNRESGMLMVSRSETTRRRRHKTLERCVRQPLAGISDFPT